MIICDIDNCISNDHHRLGLIDWNQDQPFFRYHQYHLSMVFDTAHNLELLQDESVIFLTAAPEYYRRYRERWLQRHNLKPVKMLMRPNTNHMSSVELKHAMMAHLIHAEGLKPEWINVAYDDRHDVVSMYRDNWNINAEVLAINEQEWERCSRTGLEKIKGN